MTFSKLVPLALTFFLLTSMVSISASQIFLGVAFLLWLIVQVRSKQKPEFPGFFWILLAYALLTLVSCARSDNPAVSFPDSRSLLIFLIVPLVYSGFRQKKRSVLPTWPYWPRPLSASLIPLSTFCSKPPQENALQDLWDTI